jgi:hypothetical protein
MLILGYLYVVVKLNAKLRYFSAIHKNTFCLSMSLIVNNKTLIFLLNRKVINTVSPFFY